VRTRVYADSPYAGEKGPGGFRLSIE
jgi:hypothetical protein